MNKLHLIRCGSIVAILFLSLQPLSTVFAEDFSYDTIAKRYTDVQLESKSVKEAKMHGECLVGLKRLNFKKRDDFDPVAEWTTFRSFSLLEQFPPCAVLIMMEVAREGLLAETGES